MPRALRPARDEDAPAAIEIQFEAFAELAQATWGPWDPPQARANMLAAWVTAQTRCVEVDGALAGWIRTEHPPGYDWLDLIAIGRGYRGAGLGGAVIAALIDQAAARGVPLWLSVYRTNRARTLYARMGFQTVERDPVRVLMGHPAGAGGPLVPPAERLRPGSTR